MEIKTKLIMNFKTELDKKVSITVDSPRTDLTEEEINNAMLLILSKDIFNINGASLVSLVDAKVVTTDTTEGGLTNPLEVKKQFFVKILNLIILYG